MEDRDELAHSSEDNASKSLPPPVNQFASLKDRLAKKKKGKAPKMKILAKRTSTSRRTKSMGDSLPAKEPTPESNAIPIGTIGLIIDDEPNNFAVPDLGFVILSQYMRKGYTKEAAVGLLEWLEKEKGMKDILGLHKADNVASAAVFRSLGFEDRGLMELDVFDQIGHVWTKPGMARDLRVYGLPASGRLIDHRVAPVVDRD